MIIMSDQGPEQQSSNTEGKEISPSNELAAVALRSILEELRQPLSTFTSYVGATEINNPGLLAFASSQIPTSTATLMGILERYQPLLDKPEQIIPSPHKDDGTMVLSVHPLSEAQQNPPKIEPTQP